MIYSLKLNGQAHLFFIRSLIGAIMELVCFLLAGEGRGNLQTYASQFCGNQTHRRSHCLHFWDPAEHLHFVNLSNFRTLDSRFKRSWLATAADI